MSRSPSIAFKIPIEILTSEMLCDSKVYEQIASKDGLSTGFDIEFNMGLLETETE